MSASGPSGPLVKFYIILGCSIPSFSISGHQGCFFSPCLPIFQILSHIWFILLKLIIQYSLFFLLFFKRRELFFFFFFFFFFGGGGGGGAHYSLIIIFLLFIHYSLLNKVIVLFSLNPIQTLMHSFNEHVHLSCGAPYLSFCIVRYLCPNSMCACSESSVVTAQSRLSLVCSTTLIC